MRDGEIRLTYTAVKAWAAISFNESEVKACPACTPESVAERSVKHFSSERLVAKTPTAEKTAKATNGQNPVSAQEYHRIGGKMICQSFALPQTCDSRGIRLIVLIRRSGL